jgi:hypothetical protein
MTLFLKAVIDIVEDERAQPSVVGAPPQQRRENSVGLTSDLFKP